MADTTLTARCSLPLLQPAQAQKHVTVNDAMMRLDGLRAFAAEHGCPLISIEDLVAYLEAAGTPADGNTRAGRAGGEEEIR